MANPKRIDQLDSAGAAVGTSVIPVVKSGETEAKKHTLDEVKAYAAAGTNVPAGGTTGQVLRKQSATDYDSDWGDGIPTGGTGGQILVKASGTDYDTERQDTGTALDKKVGVTGNDTTPSSLDDKITAGDGLSKTVVNPAGNETLDLNIDTSDTEIFAKTPSYIYTPAFLTGGSSAESNPLIWDSYTDGEFAITIDGVAYEITGLDFSSISTMNDVAGVIQAGIRAETGSTETCVRDTDHFVISSVNATVSSAITVTSTVGGGTGTDISGTNFMDCDSGNGTVTDKVQGGNNDEDKAVILKSDGKIDEDFIPDVFPSKATTEQAVAGTDDETYMTPAKTKQAINGGDYDVEIDFNITEDIPNSGMTINAGCGYTYIEDDSGDTYLIAKLPAKSGGINNYNQRLNLDDVDVMEMEFDAGYVSSATAKWRVGFAAQNTVFYTETTSTTHVCMDHKLNNTYVTLDTGSGTTQSAGNNVNIAGNYYSINSYKIVFNKGTDAKLYVNGTLGDTKTTDLPTTGLISVGLGALTVSTAMSIQNCKVRIKYT